MALPLLLAGPILRRCERERVCIWLATSDDVAVRAEVLAASADRDALGSSDPTLGGSETSVRLGDQLVVHLLEVRPPSGATFPADTLLYYDLTVGGRNLDELGLLDGDGGIAYAGLPLPSFFLPTTLSTLLHGSCRKPHVSAIGEAAAAATPDCLAAADLLVEGAPNDLGQRPAVLFLTGDQIYADDVAGPLLAQLRTLGDELTGWREAIPGIGEAAGIPLFERRAALESAGSGFTSTKGEHHLLTFGEYAAMYLTMWGGVALAPPPWEAVEASLPPRPADQREALRRTYEAQRAEIAAFGESLPRVRRALANIPTYMIFDDHEVTDDWNLHRAWYREVSESAAGRRVVANALAAYWAFQGWGNYPEGHSSRLIDAISDHLCSKVASGSAAERFERRLWGKQGWGYVVPTDPPVIVLDTRTQREFDSNRGPARLMDRYGLGWLRMAWADLRERRGDAPEDRTPLIVVSATPVYGFELVEFLQKVGIAFGKKPSDLDFESWIANRDGFGALMRTIGNDLRPSWCLFLSGDVHYSFTTRATFESDGESLEVWQATSSPLKNTAHRVKLLERFSRWTEGSQRRFGWRDGHDVPLYFRLMRPLVDISVRFGWRKWDTAKYPVWTDTVEGVQPDGERRLVTGDNNLGVVRFADGRPSTHELLRSATDAERVLRYRLTRERP